MRFAITSGANGQALFTSKGCAGCHTGNLTLPPRLKNKTLTDIAVEEIISIILILATGFGQGGFGGGQFGGGDPGLTPISISPRQRLDDVVRTIEAIPMGGTDCAPTTSNTVANSASESTGRITTSRWWRSLFQEAKPYRRATTSWASARLNPASSAVR